MKLIKPQGASWRDVFSSRMNQLSVTLFAIFQAVNAGDLSLTDLGVPDGWAKWFMAFTGLLVVLGYMGLRADTRSPLAGRRNGK